MRSLVVDDEQMSRMMLAMFLETHGSCVQAPSGKEALELYGEAFDAGDTFDLVCLDIGMPGMSGIETLRRIREIEHAQGVESKCRVFMMTASNFYEDLDAAFANGMCDEYLLKPFNGDDMTQLLTRYALS